MQYAQDLNFQAETQVQVSKKRSHTLYYAVLLMCPMLFRHLLSNKDIFLNVPSAPLVSCLNIFSLIIDLDTRYSIAEEQSSEFL
jgi:hypothetical protein